MPKQKQFLKQHKGKRPQPDPETADEFLAVGVDFEEAGEKWRAGDAAKSCRFFVRAVEAYESGLRRFPRSFDLAYNKARVQYDLSQQPRLLLNLPTGLFDLLQAALESHRYALNLKRDDANTLFNTAQVLTSISETLIESSSPKKDEVVTLLQEALSLFQRCLEVQETQLAESEAQVEAATTMEPASSPESDRLLAQDPTASSVTSSSMTEEQWATILEPTTLSTLLDTCIAQIQTITTLIPLCTPSPSVLEPLHNTSTSLLSKAATYAPNPAQQSLLSLPQFNLLAVLSDLSYRSSLLSAPAYLESLNSTFFQNPYLSTNPAAPTLCDLADALITFNASLTTTANAAESSSSTDQSPTILLPLRWKALSSALSSLASADSLPSSAGNRSALNARRAEAELLRARLADAPWSFDQALASKDTLLRNAQTFYRGARRLAGIEGDVDTERQMGLRWGVVTWLRTRDWMEVDRELGAGVGRGDLWGALWEMGEEGLVGEGGSRWDSGRGLKQG